MGINRSLADQAEKLAKKMAKKKYGSTGMWEMCLGDAYEEIEHAEFTLGVPGKEVAND